MPTGIEIAGLTLVIFPIVVQCLRFYLEGCQKIKEASQYRGTLKRLYRKFGMGKVKFENTCGRDGIG
ncbi:hypothetical protein BDD12DRAFT_835622 [Trichophaea hybrida]|nr:hypothetical protein BDD12DRAFT_835622 [Trichophaea hybrida]